MFWDIVFWLLLILLAIPLPFKIFGYVKGTDDSKAAVKVEEITNALFMSFGLIALYGYRNNTMFFEPIVWKVWLAIAITWSVTAIFWSPKLSYAAEVMGQKKTRILAAISSLLYAPLLVAVYFYAFYS